METMTDRIMAVAKTMGMSKMAEVERYCGIPVRTLTNMAGGHKPKDSTMRKICETLGITEDYVLNGTDEPEAIADQQTVSERPKLESKKSRPDKLRQFVRLLASMDDKEFDTVIEYMMFLKRRKG